MLFRSVHQHVFWRGAKQLGHLQLRQPHGVALQTHLHGLAGLLEQNDFAHVDACCLLRQRVPGGHEGGPVLALAAGGAVFDVAAQFFQIVRVVLGGGARQGFHQIGGLAAVAAQVVAAQGDGVGHAHGFGSAQHAGEQLPT